VELLTDGQREPGDFAVARHRGPLECCIVIMRGYENKNASRCETYRRFFIQHLSDLGWKPQRHKDTEKILNCISVIKFGHAKYNALTCLHPAQSSKEKGFPQIPRERVWRIILPFRGWPGPRSP
ncbi:MAG: hypothetical protein ACLQVW_14100, partial [Limisphaerales bacterium]